MTVGFTEEGIFEMTALLIAREESEFELPLEHSIRFYRGATGPMAYVVIEGEDGGSLFRVHEIEERPDAIVVHVTDEIATTRPSPRAPVVLIRAERHRHAAETHDKAARCHEDAARYWAKLDDSAHVESERRKAKFERGAARLERDRADREERVAARAPQRLNLERR